MKKNDVKGIPGAVSENEDKSEGLWVSAGPDGAPWASLPAQLLQPGFGWRKGFSGQRRQGPGCESGLPLAPLPATLPFHVLVWTLTRWLLVLL